MNVKDLGECCALCLRNQANCVIFSFLVDKSICLIYSYPWQNSIYRPWTMSGGILRKNPDPSSPIVQTTQLNREIASPQCTFRNKIFLSNL